ncbi:MAG: type II secretion system protein, partial [Phycisphaerae bacterium]|nr:type II secretion system protein [Phycisphaerae bacterium]
MPRTHWCKNQLWNRPTCPPSGGSRPMRRRQAFTLIEVVMAVAIMSIIGLSIAGASMALS